MEEDMGTETGFTWLKEKEEAGAQLCVRSGILIIQMHADLDHHNALWIREQADKMIERQNVKHILFDFTGVEFMDSSGIGVIMGRYKKVIFTGGKAAVCNVGSAVDRIMRMSGLYKIIEKYDNLEEALKGLC